MKPGVGLLTFLNLRWPLAAERWVCEPELDAFRRPERFKQFLIACECDSRGRAGYENKDFSQAKYFFNALEITKEIDIDTLKNKGLEGKTLGLAIKEERIKILKESIIWRYYLVL
mgnify:CR=1 FL=1